MKFESFNLNTQILSAIAQKGYTDATPIQEKSIPPILERKDLLGCAQTGTGKTASFAIPTLQILSEERNAGNNGGDWSAWKKKGIKCLIVTPTRELAIQIDENIAEYGKGSGMKHTVIFGGVKQHHQVLKIEKGVDILTATPGRLLDLMNQKIISLQDLKVFVLDEADRMLDMGFIHDVKKIIKALPAKRQSLFFSATMPRSIIDLANSLLTNPTKITVAPVSSTAETVAQKLYLVPKKDKKELLLSVLQKKEVERVLVFTRTKHFADKLAKFITSNGVNAEAIHGNKSQNFRQNALAKFKEGTIKVLVATDLAARGIDIDKLSHVINFEIPNEPETYVHRIGRTGRAKNSGVALSFCDEEETLYIHDIQKLIGKEIPLETNHDFVGTHKVSDRKKAVKTAQRGRSSRTSQPKSSRGSQSAKKAWSSVEKPSGKKTRNAKPSFGSKNSGGGKRSNFGKSGTKNGGKSFGGGSGRSSGRGR